MTNNKLKPSNVLKLNKILGNLKTELKQITNT